MVDALQSSLHVLLLGGAAASSLAREGVNQDESQCGVASSVTRDRLRPSALSLPFPSLGGRSCLGCHSPACSRCLPGMTPRTPLYAVCIGRPRYHRRSLRHLRHGEGRWSKTRSRVRRIRQNCRGPGPFPAMTGASSKVVLISFVSRSSCCLVGAPQSGKPKLALLQSFLLQFLLTLLWEGAARESQPAHVCALGGDRARNDSGARRTSQVAAKHAIRTIDNGNDRFS